MWKRFVIVIIILIIIFGGVFAWDYVRNQLFKSYLAAASNPPLTISTVTAKAVTWHNQLTANGSIEAVNGVEVTTQQAGMIISIDFNSGQMVKKGQLLVQLDDSVQRAQLANYQAAYHNDVISYERAKALYDKKFESPQGLDSSYTTMKQAQAQVLQYQTIIKQMHITAPFTGKIGINEINLGQYLNPGDSIASLQQMDPLHINFSLPQQDLSLLNIGLPVSITVDGLANKTFKGIITAINSNVSDDTRMIMVQATVPNPELTLYPGYYCDVTVQLKKQQHFVTVPQTAVTYDLNGDIVYVVTPNKDANEDQEPSTPQAKNFIAQKAQQKAAEKVAAQQAANGKADTAQQQTLYAYQRYVKTGPRRGNQIAITEGLQAGDIVVSSGQIKLQNGSRVLINNNDALK